MFTGLIQAVGTVAGAEHRPDGRRLRIRCPELAGAIAVDDSIAMQQEATLALVTESHRQAGMGVMYELDAIAMAVIGGVSLAGGRGSIIGTVLGAAIFSVIISGFTSIRLDAYYQEMVKGAIIVGAVVLDQWRQRQRTRG